MTTSSVLPQWLAPDQAAQVEFGHGSGLHGIFFKATIVEVDLTNNIVRVHIAERDSHAKQYHLNGQDMYVEIHRLHPANDADRLIPKAREQFGLPAFTPRLGGRAGSGTVESSFSYKRRRNNADGTISDSAESESDRETSLMSWNSVSTSFYNIAAGLSRMRSPEPPSPHPSARRTSFSASVSHAAQYPLEQLKHVPQVMRAWSHWSAIDDEEDENNSDGDFDEIDGSVLDFLASDDDYDYESEDEGDEDLAALPGLSGAKCRDERLLGHKAGDQVSAMLGGAWYDGVVLERLDGGQNYLIRLEDPPNFCAPERQFWSCHVRKFD